jgi:hypothetical protein
VAGRFFCFKVALQKKMKFSVMLLLILGTAASYAQPVLLPGKKAVEKKWIKNEQYQIQRDLKWAM